MQTLKTKTFYDWYFISIYKVNRTLHYFTHSWEILSAREDKIRIPKRPFTILYIFTPHDDWAIIRVGTLSSSAWYWCCTRVLSLITFHSNSQHTAVKKHIHRKWAEFLKIKAMIFSFYICASASTEFLEIQLTWRLRIPTVHIALLLEKMAAVIRAWTRAQLICHLLMDELGDSFLKRKNAMVV